MQSKNLSSTIAHNEHGITFVQGQDEFCILPPTDMAKRETIGKRLQRARLETGMNVPQLREKILQEHGSEVGETTIRDIERDKASNPGIKTIELLALGVGLDPLEVMGLALDDPPELENGFKESQFAQIWKKYQRVAKDQKPFIDDFVKMLIRRLDQ